MCACLTGSIRALPLPGVAVARPERFHLFVLENLHRRSRRAFALREREERLLRLRDQGAREIIRVNRVVARRRGPVGISEDQRRAEEGRRSVMERSECDVEDAVRDRFGAG